MENILCTDESLLGKVNKDLETLIGIRDAYLDLAIETDSLSCWAIASILSKAQGHVVDVIRATYK